MAPASLRVTVSAMRRGRCLIAAALPLAGCMLVACGSGGPALSGEQARVASALERSLTTRESRDCGHLFTQAYLEQMSGKRGEDALLHCRYNLEGQAVRAVWVKRVRIAGDTAIADVELDGPSELKAATIGLRRDGGSWLTGRYRDATLDRRAVLRSMKAVASEVDSLPFGTGDCAVRRLASFGDVELAVALLGGTMRELNIAVGDCALRIAWRRVGARPSVIDCISRRVRREMTSGDAALKLDVAESWLGDRASGIGPSKAELARLGRRIARRCAAAG